MISFTTNIYALEESPEYIKTIGNDSIYSTSSPMLSKIPFRVDLDSFGNIYLGTALSLGVDLDAGVINYDNSILKFKPNGDLDKSFANQGILIANCNDDRDFSHVSTGFALAPTIVKIDSQNNLNVLSNYSIIGGDGSLSYSNSCIQKFDLNGNFLSGSNQAFSDSGIFSSEGIIANMDNEFNFYSYSTSTNEVSKFDPIASSTVLQFNYDIDDVGRLYTVTSIWVDKRGNIYVLDSSTSSSRISQFDSNGNLLKRFLDLASFKPSAIQSDNDGNIYELLSSHLPYPTILKYNSNGEYVAYWHTVPGDTNDTAQDLAIYKNNIYVVTKPTDDIENMGIQLYSYPHQDEEQPTNNQTSITYFSPAIIACDPTLYTTHGYLSPKPGGLPACGGDSQTNTGPATITFSDGAVYTINSSINTNQITTNPLYNGNNTQTDNPLYNSNNFTKDLTLGSTSEDVKTLQIYLNTHGYLLTQTGAGSPGNETNYFGNLTRVALSNYQKDNGIIPAVGYFGPITRNFILNN